MTDDSGVAPLGADQVREAALATRRGGYDQPAVDQFLDEVADQLERPVGARTLTAQSVAGQVFETVGLRTGYAELDVDQLLDRVQQHLRADEANAPDASAPDAAGTAPPVAEPPSGAPGPAALPDLPPEAEAAPPVQVHGNEPSAVQFGGSPFDGGSSPVQPAGSWLARLGGRWRRRGG